MATYSNSTRAITAPRNQNGAVLYVALIMLILLALLGIAGMQVAGMQEKMASNYRAANRAFQNSEGVVRNAERSVASTPLTRMNRWRTSPTAMTRSAVPG